MGASYQVRGSIAVITLDNPPVNGLGYDTRREFAAGVDRARWPTRPSAPSWSPARAGLSPAAPTSRSSAAPRPLPSPTC
jgi:3-hydroxyacyl-CoA dehydrogenase